MLAPSEGFPASMSFTLIAGPCVIESRELVMEIAERVKEITQRLGITYVFKASFDKANRSSGGSFRGPGVAEGLAGAGGGEGAPGPAGAHRHPREPSRRRRWRRWWTCCRFPPSSAARPTFCWPRPQP